MQTGYQPDVYFLFRGYKDPIKNIRYNSSTGYFFPGDGEVEFVRV
jgi:hypothetical protein